MYSALLATNAVGLILGSQVVRRLNHLMAERSFLILALILSCISSVLAMSVILLHGPLMPLMASLFVFMASMGMTATSTFLPALSH